MLLARSAGVRSLRSAEPPAVLKIAHENKLLGCVRQILKRTHDRKLSLF